MEVNSELLNGPKDQLDFNESAIMSCKSRQTSTSISKKDIFITFIEEWLVRGSIAILCWTLIWSLTGPISLPPGSPIFSLLIIWLTAYALGQLCQQLSLPPLLGMMISGIVLSNVGLAVLNQRISSGFRSTALTIILLRAGLGLDPKVIRSLSGVCFRLAFLPCLVEAAFLALTSHLIMNLPLQWGALLGFIIGAVSPAVIVPSMIDLQEHGFGLDQGIPSLIIASSSVDDILAITGFDVVLSFAFVSHHSSLVWNIIRGPTEAIIGLLIGVFLGFVLWYLPKPIPSSKLSSSSSADNIEELIRTCQRFGLTILIGLSVVFISNSFDAGGIGPLAALVVTFVAAIGWRPQGHDTSVDDGLKIGWMIFEPFLFALIGAEIKLSELQLSQLGPVTLCLLISLFFRLAATFIAVVGTQFNWKEKLFISIAWLPKATVQAAIGPVALDMARSRGDQEAIERGTLVLTVAILSILLTAPIGAILIKFSGPKLLRKSLEHSTKAKVETNRESC